MNTNYWIPAIAGGFTLIGVIIGAVLKPFIEQYFENRRRTIRVEVGKNYTFESPHEELTFHWRDHKFLKLINTSFQVINSTGKTIRNVRVIIEVPSKSTGENFAYLAIPNDQTGSKIAMSDPFVWPITISMDYIESGCVLRGYVLSDYCQRFTIYTPDDYEMVVRTVGENVRTSSARKLIEVFGAALGVSAIVTAVTALLS